MWTGMSRGDPMGDRAQVRGEHREGENMDRGMGQGLTRRGFITLTGAAGLTVAMSGVLSACGRSADDAVQADAAIDYSDWDAVLAAAAGQTVSWYGWGGSEPRNNWIADVLAPALKERYDITLDLVGMDINDILTQLSGEMQAGTETGSIDFIWINGENFYSARDNGYLWGPFAGNLPNFQKYIDQTSPEVLYDFGSPIEGFEAPYGKAQMQLWVDGATIADPPMNPDEFLEFCKANEGKVTYPQPGDFTGTAFIESLMAGVVGKDEFEKLSQMTDPTAESIKEILEPGFEYLRSLNPYLWNQGATFPADSTTVNSMYADGELVMCMGYSDPQAMVDDGTLPSTTRTFVFDSGTVGNSNFMAIAANAPHKAAAMVAINEVMSPEMQLSQLENLGNITVLDMDKLDEADRQAFESVEPGSAQLPVTDLLSARVAEAAGPCVPLIEQIWLEEVVGK